MIVNLETFVTALRTNLNPYASLNDRRQSDENLLGIKNTNSKDVFMCLIQVLYDDNGIYDNDIRQVVLILLHDWIQLWWNHHSLEDQQIIKSSILQLVTQSNVSSSKPMRTKLSVTIASIAKRQYPQYWESFVTDMINIWLSSTIEKQQLIMNAIEILITDCIDPDFSNNLPTGRKQDILSAIKLQASPLLQICSQYLQFCFNEYQTLLSHDNNNNQIKIQQKIVSDVIKSLFQLINILITYLKADEIYKLQFDLFNIITLLSIPTVIEFVEEVVNIAYNLTSSKLIEFDTFHVLLQYICTNPLQSVDLDGYDCMYTVTEWLSIQEIYAKTVLNLLYYNIPSILYPVYKSTSNNTAVLSSPRNLTPITTLSGSELRIQYFQLLASICSYPSLRLAYDLLPNWSTIFHDTEITHLDLMSPLCQVILSEYLNKSIRVIWIYKNHEMTCQDKYIAAEFDTYEEYQELLNYYKSQIRPLLTVLLKRHPKAVVHEMNQRIQYLLTQEINNIYNYLHENTGYGVIKKDSSLLLRGLETLIAIFDECIKFIHLIMFPIPNYPLPDTHVKKDDVIYQYLLTMIWSIFDIILQWSPLDPNLMNMKIKLLLSYGPILSTEPTRMQQLLSFFFNNLYFQVNIEAVYPSNTPINTLTPKMKNKLDKLKEALLEDGVIVRRRLAAGISKLCDYCASCIVTSSFYHEFVIQVSNLIGDNQNTLLAGQRASLRECLIVLSENTMNIQQRDELLHMALEAVVNQWYTISSYVFQSISIMIQELKQQVIQTKSFKLQSATTTTTTSLSSVSTSSASSSNSNMAMTAALSTSGSNSGSTSGSDIAPSLQLETNSGIFTQIKSILNTIISLSKHVIIPLIEEKIWIENISYNLDSISSIFPFSKTWTFILPGITQAIKLIHELWHPTVRNQINGDDNISIYIPTKAYILRIGSSSSSSSNMDNPVDSHITDSTSASSISPLSTTTEVNNITIGSILEEIRRLLYQILGWCCIQNVFYYYSEHTVIIQNIIENIMNLENNHLTILMNQFLIKYIINAPPSSYPIVSVLIQHLLSHCQERLSISWNPSPNSLTPSSNNATDFYINLYKHSSIPLQGLNEISTDIIDIVKERIIIAYSRTLADTLCTLACLQGPLAEKPISTSSSSGSTTVDDGFILVTSSSSSSNKKKNKGKKPQMKPVSSDGELSSSSGTMGTTSAAAVSGVQCDRIAEMYYRALCIPLAKLSVFIMQQDSTYSIHRKGIQELLFAPTYAQTTKSYIHCILALLCCPDSVCIRKGTSLSDYILKISMNDTRLQPIVAKDFFTTLLSIIVEEKKATIGLEWDIVESLQSIYCQYVLGYDPSNPITTTTRLIHTDPAFLALNTTNTYNKPSLNMTGTNNTMEIQGGSNDTQKWNLLMEKRRQGVEEFNMISNIPRLILLEIPNMTPIRVFQLEYMLLTALATKKQKRDIFRDFLKDVILCMKPSSSTDLFSSSTSTTSTLSQQESIFHTTNNGNNNNNNNNLSTSLSSSSILNIQQRVMRPKLNQGMTSALDGHDFSLGSIFDE